MARPIKTLDQLCRGDRVITGEFPQEVLQVLEEPHPLLIGAGLEVQVKRPNGKVVHLKHFHAVKDKQKFEVVRGIEDLDTADIGAMIREAVIKAVAPILAPLERVGRAPIKYSGAIRDAVAIFSGEVVSEIKEPS